MKKHYSIVLLTILLFISFLIWRFPSNIYKYPVSEKQHLNEAAALEMTRKALVDHGLDDSILQAVPYKRGKGLFAQNTLDQNRGYVLWQTDVNKSLYSYIVFIEKLNNQFVIQIEEPH